MQTSLQEYAADHRYLLDAVRRQGGLADPVAVDFDEFHTHLLKAATRGPLLPLDGVLVRDWDPNNRRTNLGASIGMRLYEVEGIRFAWLSFWHDTDQACSGLHFTAVGRADYGRLYKIALRLRRDAEPIAVPPVLAADQLEVLYKNTIGYLETANLTRIRAYGGRAKRGILLTGAPGNGKTMACRWIWEECRRRGWEYHIVAPDEYREARQHNTVKSLFTVDRRGVVFFDDMDLALRDRDKADETDDQAIFLGALDGIEINEGAVFVFTTNCGLDLIDRAFKRPGRLDVVLHFRPPDADLRRRLIERWHRDIRASIDRDAAVASTDGFSFAEIEELKNLLVMGFMESGAWSWPRAVRQFEFNRSELAARPASSIGFRNGVAHNGR